MPRYKITGYDRKTNQPASRTVEAENEDQAVKMVALITESVKKLPENQNVKSSPHAGRSSHPAIIPLLAGLSVIGLLAALVMGYFLFTAESSQQKIDTVSSKPGVVEQVDVPVDRLVEIEAELTEDERLALEIGGKLLDGRYLPANSLETIDGVNVVVALNPAALALRLNANQIESGVSATLRQQDVPVVYGTESGVYLRVAIDVLRDDTQIIIYTVSLQVVCPVWRITSDQAVCFTETIVYDALVYGYAGSAVFDDSVDEAIDGLTESYADRWHRDND